MVCVIKRAGFGTLGQLFAAQANVHVAKKLQHAQTDLVFHRDHSHAFKAMQLYEMDGIHQGFHAAGTGRGVCADVTNGAQCLCRLTGLYLGGLHIFVFGLVVELTTRLAFAVLHACKHTIACCHDQGLLVCRYEGAHGVGFHGLLQQAVHQMLRGRNQTKPRIAIGVGQHVHRGGVGNVFDGLRLLAVPQSAEAEIDFFTGSWVCG